MSVERVYVDVGGHVYVSTRATLEKCPLLKDLLAQSEDGVPFVDRDGNLFHFVLNFLRTGSVCVEERQTLQQLLVEAGFYGLKAMEALVSRQLAQKCREAHDASIELRGVKEELQRVSEALRAAAATWSKE